jgi:ABC-type phosphate transport system ATPase subunit
MIVVTHDPAQAERLSERHYMMAQGRLTPDQEILS